MLRLKTSSKFEKQYKKLANADKEAVIYKIQNEHMILACVQIGSHSLIFG